MRSVINATALLAVFSSSSLQAAPLAPTEKWVVDFAEAQCVATRNYGPAAKPLLLAFKQPVAGDIMQVAVIRKGASSNSLSEQTSGKIRINDGPSIPSSMIKFSVKQRNERVAATNIATGHLAAARIGSSTLTFTASPDVNVTFQLGNLEPLMKVMSNCVADLRKLWNASDNGSAALKTGPVGTLQGLIKAEDYPSAAIEQQSSGRVAFVVLINEQGRVADCTVVETSGIAALDAQSCAIVVERARFTPAVGADGRPAKSTFKQRITWQIVQH